MIRSGYPLTIATVLSLVLGWSCTASVAAPRKSETSLDAVGHYMFGLQLYNDGRYAEAEAQLGRAIQLRPADAFALSARGLVRGKLHRFKESMQDHAKAIKLLPHTPELFDARGQTNDVAGKVAAAIADYTHAMHLGDGTRDVQPLLHRGSLYFRLAKYREALRDLNACVDLCNYCPEPLYYRALTEQKLGDLTTSRKDLEAARRHCLQLMKRSYRHVPRPPLGVLLRKIEDASLSLRQG